MHLTIVRDGLAAASSAVNSNAICVPPSWVERTREVRLMKARTRNGAITIWMRPYTIRDKVAVFTLLSDLPTLYPGGGVWLEKRLGEVQIGKAVCSLAVSTIGLIGVTIETPKGAHALKLSTIFVARSFRRLGAGSLLLGRCLDRWFATGVKHVHVTADQRRASSLLPLLESAGFAFAGVEYDRYGHGRNEVIFRWNQDGQICNHLYPAVFRECDFLPREAFRISTSTCQISDGRPDDRLLHCPSLLARG
jgi:GNAT superfamily N-acetyltransferase